MGAKSYLEKRIYEDMNVSPEDCMIKLRVEGQYGIEKEVDVPIFTSDNNDNIDILVYDLNRRPIEYDIPEEEIGQTARLSDNGSLTKRWKLKRLNPRNIPEGGDNKYRMPKGGGIYPFLPPKLVAKYESREKIPMLVLTEGYFKAFCASLHGWDIVGLSSITHYADSHTKKMHPAITEIIDKCKVETVVILYDGDCTNISAKALERMEELTKRPRTFLNALRKTRELLLESTVNIYFAHVLSAELKGAPKGLDDLLMSPEYANKEEEIYADLANLQNVGQYFYRSNLRKYVQRLNNYFNIANVNQFYEAWKDSIGLKEFVFNGSNYQFDQVKEALTMKVPRELKNYCRVGDEYFEWVKVPSIFSKTTNEEDCIMKLFKRDKQTIKDDFGIDAIQKIAKYKTFINFPDHLDYKHVVNNCYNMYSPIKYKPEPSEGGKRAWKYIDMTLHHIFGEQYEMGLDYLQNLYLRPKQKLPILCLVSKERGTGKTSFLNLLHEIFGANCSIGGNADMMDGFNGFIVGKLLVCCDETSLGDNNVISEKIKNWSTAQTIQYNEKNMKKVEVENFAKFILTSNNVVHFIGIKREEVRYWVREIKPFTDEEFATFGCRKLGDVTPLFQEEIPAFLSYLIDRKFYTDYETIQDRMFFSPEMIETDVLRRIKQEQRPQIEKDLYEALHDYFMDYKVEEVLLCVKDMRVFCDSTAVARADDNKIKDCIKEVFKATKMGNQRYFFYQSIVDNVGEHRVKYDKIGRPYLFKAENILTKEELESIRR